MNVTVQETGRQVVAIGIHDVCAFADAIIHIAHSRNRISADGNAAVIDFAGIDVDDFAVADHKISRRFTFCYGQ